MPAGLNQVYGRSLHRDHDGEWDYDLAWKPLGGFAVRAGWLPAIRTAQAPSAGRARHRGAGAGRHVDRDIPRSTWSDEAHHADAVLDPADMARWAPGLGRHVTLVRFEGAQHDLALSQAPVRQAGLHRAGNLDRRLLPQRTRRAIAGTSECTIRTDPTRRGGGSADWASAGADRRRRTCGRRRDALSRCPTATASR